MVLVVSEGLVDLSTGKLGTRRDCHIHRAARPDHRDDVMHPNPCAFDGQLRSRGSQPSQQPGFDLSSNAGAIRPVRSIVERQQASLISFAMYLPFSLLNVNLFFFRHGRLTGSFFTIAGLFLCIAAQTRAAPITSGETISGRIGQPAASDRYEFEASINETIALQIVVTSGTMEAEITLYDPDGALLGQTSGSTLGSIFRQVPRTGVYSVLVQDSSFSRTGVGNYTLRLSGNTVLIKSLRIITYTSSQTVRAGNNVSFTVTASGTPPVSYQWRKNGISILDATSATLTLTSVAGVNSGGYSVIVRNDTESVVSATAYLAVLNQTVAPAVLEGRVSNVSGKPVAGATVTAKLFDQPAASVQTDPNGSYRLPALPEQIYELSAGQVGYVSDQRVFRLSPATRSQSFLLVPSPKPYQTGLADGIPPVTYVPSPEADEGSRLLVFDGNTFTDNLSLLARNKMLTVLTHGWNSNPQVWALPMAKAMKEKGITLNANIVVWDWQRAAVPLTLAVLRTPRQGIALGQALQSTAAFGLDYTQPVHFIGHSLGTLVNRFAVDYLRGAKQGTGDLLNESWR